MKRMLASLGLLAGVIGAPVGAIAGQVPAAASDPDIPVSSSDRVYAAEQFSNTISVTDPSTNKLLGVIKLGDPQKLRGVAGNVERRRQSVPIAENAKLAPGCDLASCSRRKQSARLPGHWHAGGIAFENDLVEHRRRIRGFLSCGDGR